VTPDNHGQVPPRLDYASPPKPPVGDQMLMGVGCFASGALTLAALMLPAVVAGGKLWLTIVGMGLTILVGTGIGFGVRGRRWGFLQGIAIGAFALGTLVGLAWAFLHWR